MTLQERKDKAEKRVPGTHLCVIVTPQTSFLLKLL